MQKYLKCIFGGITAGLGSLSLATVDNSSVTFHEWIVVAVAATGTAFTVWGVTNAPVETVADVDVAEVPDNTMAG